MIRLLAIAGVLAPVAFATSAVAHSVSRDDHNLLRNPVSALAAGPTGWVQDLTFAGTGMLMIGFSLGLHLTLRPSRRIDLGPQLVGLFGLALIASAVWPAVDTFGAFAADRLPHVIAGFVAFGSAPVAALALAPRLARDLQFAGLARYVRGAGVVLLLLFLTIGVLVRPAGGPLHDWLGLFQWIFLAVWFPCIAVLAGRTLSVGTNGRQDPATARRES